MAGQASGAEVEVDAIELVDDLVEEEASSVGPIKEAFKACDSEELQPGAAHWADSSCV